MRELLPAHFVSAIMLNNDVEKISYKELKETTKITIKRLEEELKKSFSLHISSNDYNTMAFDNKDLFYVVADSEDMYIHLRDGKNKEKLSKLKENIPFCYEIIINESYNYAK